MELTNIKIVSPAWVRTILTLVFLAWGSMAVAFDNVVVRLFDNREMVAGTYTSFCRDADGFLWIGTDSGLLCFDGNNCDVYRNDETTPGSIGDNKVFSLFCDRRGTVWVGTANGLNYYDGKTGTFGVVKLPGLGFNGFIGDILEYDEDHIMFLVGGVGLFSVSIDAVLSGENGEISAERLDMGFGDGEMVSAIVNLGPDGYLATTLSGNVFMVRPDGGKDRLASVKSNVNHVSIEKSGSIIIAGQYDVFRLDIDRHEIRPLRVGDGKVVKITDIHEYNGVTYFSTAGSGLWEVRDGSDVLMRTDCVSSGVPDFETLKIGSLFADNGGNLWLGCNHKGVALMPSGKNVQFVTKPLSKLAPGVTGDEITCMDVVGGRIVAGLNTGYLLVLDNEGNLVGKIAVPGNCLVTSVVADGTGHALVGLAREGIWRLDMATLGLSRLTTIDRPYPGVVLSVAPGGEIIAGASEAGILRYNPLTGEKVWYDTDDGSKKVSSLYYSGAGRTSDGKIWVGCYSGLSCYDPERGDLIEIDQSPFLNGVVHAVCDARDGDIMIATGRGLLKYNSWKGVVRKYTVSDGLADNDVRTLVSDSKGGIWIGTLNGLSYLPVDGERIQTYHGAMGLSQKSCVMSGQLRNRRLIVMGAHEGLTFFNPDSVRPYSFGADIRISGIYLNGNRVTPSSLRNDDTPIIEGSAVAPEVIHLSYKDNSVVLRLSTMDFRDSSGVRYEWQLGGDGDKWHSASMGENFLYLPPLDPGKYVLRIRGWENDICSDVSEINLDITPPWYLSNLAYFGYFLVALVIAGLLFKVIKNKREEELNEARIKYFMDISHEIRSPITLLLNPIETLLKQGQSPETTSQLLTAQRNARRVLNLADQLLDLRRIEKGKMHLEYVPTDIKAFIEELVDMFRPQAEEKRQVIGFSCKEKSVWGKVDRNNLDKILVNLISNAIKYTPTEGEIAIELSVTGAAAGKRMYVIKVTDTGIGLDNKLIKHMFERFYRGRDGRMVDSSGFGIGLDLCMRLVSLHGGEISGENRGDGVKGSVFTVSLPLIPVAVNVSGGGSREENGGKLASSYKETRSAIIPTVVPDMQEASKMTAGSPRCRVLVVDDDVELREYIRASLGAAFKVVAVGDVDEAIREIVEKQPDIVVTDIHMDMVDGFELLRRVKNNLSTHHIPVILLSSSNQLDDRTRGWKQGADGYLAKPFSIEELEVMITGILSTRNKLRGKFSGDKVKIDTIATPKIVGRDEELMKKVNKYINDNLSETSLSVDSLSEYVGLSRSQFHRRLKEIIGISPSDYIRNVKLQKACEMLRQTDLDIAQVAYSLGFNAQSHFSTLFKRFTGITPSDYRAREQGNEGAGTQE